MKKILIYLCLLILFVSVLYPTNVQAISVDDIFDGADEFIEKGGGEAGVSTTIDDTKLKETSDFLYNVLLGLSIIIAVIVGMVLGIKYMMATSEEKADIKQTLPAYITSCVIVFGAFTIWRLVISVLQ